VNKKSEAVPVHSFRFAIMSRTQAATGSASMKHTLRQAGIKTAIICGNSFQGATVGTASGAAQRGYQVILPVDCSAGEDAYREQCATFHLAKGGPVIVTGKVTITRSTMVKF
jgi:nicotinamidase-related amidase